jgi:predicted GNAT family acetyltransferase
MEVTVSDPPVVVTDNGPASRYEIRVGDQLAGFAEYEHTPRGITFTHTKMEDRFEGHGLGSRLAAGALDDARRQGMAVTLRCPFIAEFIETHPEYSDLVARSSGTNA